MEEAKMNKQELIDHCKTLKENKNGFINCIDVDRIINTIKQLDEPQKVTIPQFVADYIEFKKKYNFHVYGAMRVIENHYDKRVPEWFYEGNIEKFCLAWILGYEVEKTKYVVTDGNHLYFKGYQEDVDIVILVDEQPGTMEYVKKFDTKEEAQKTADILGWKVQEVE